MSVWQRRALRIQAKIDGLLEDAGVTWVIRETGEAFKALEKPLAINDLPDLWPEGVDNSINELGPIQLTAVTRSVALKVNQNVYRQIEAEPYHNNFIVRSVDPEVMADVVTRQFAVVSRAPIKR